VTAKRPSGVGEDAAPTVTSSRRTTRPSRRSVIRRAERSIRIAHGTSRSTARRAAIHALRPFARCGERTPSQRPRRATTR
jgi:hypothetical protein